MASKASVTKGANKSDVIREILKQQPKATVKEVRAALQERGVKSSDALINKIKYGRKHKPGAKKTRKGRGSNSHVNKADAIRTAWSELGASARPRDIIATLASRGVAVSSAQVSTLRNQQPKRGAASMVHSVSLEHLVAAKELADRVGGIDVARQALASLAKLMER